MATNSVFWAVTAIRMKYAYFKRYTYVARKKNTGNMWQNIE